jgi:hypothetical protein
MTAKVLRLALLTIALVLTLKAPAAAVVCPSGQTPCTIVSNACFSAGGNFSTTMQYNCTDFSGNAKYHYTWTCSKSTPYGSSGSCNS